MHPHIISVHWPLVQGTHSSHCWQRTRFATRPLQVQARGGCRCRHRTRTIKHSGTSRDEGGWRCSYRLRRLICTQPHTTQIACGGSERRCRQRSQSSAKQGVATQFECVAFGRQPGALHINAKPREELHSLLSTTSLWIRGHNPTRRKRW